MVSSRGVSDDARLDPTKKALPPHGNDSPETHQEASENHAQINLNSISAEQSFKHAGKHSTSYPAHKSAKAAHIEKHLPALALTDGNQVDAVLKKMQDATSNDTARTTDLSGLAAATPASLNFQSNSLDLTTTNMPATSETRVVAINQATTSQQESILRKLSAVTSTAQSSDAILSTPPGSLDVSVSNLAPQSLSAGLALQLRPEPQSLPNQKIVKPSEFNANTSLHPSSVIAQTVATYESTHIIASEKHSATQTQLVEVAPLLSPTGPAESSAAILNAIENHKAASTLDGNITVAAPVVDRITSNILAPQIIENATNKQHASSDNVIEPPATTAEVAQNSTSITTADNKVAQASTSAASVEQSAVILKAIKNYKSELSTSQPAAFDNATATKIKAVEVAQALVTTTPQALENAAAQVQTAASDNAIAPQLKTTQVADAVTSPAKLEKSGAIIKSLESYKPASNHDTNTNIIADKAAVATNVAYQPAAIKDSTDNGATISVAAVERFTTNTPAPLTPETAPARIQTLSLDNATAPQARTIQVADAVTAPAQLEKSSVILKSLASYQSASTLEINTNTISDRAELATNVDYKPAAIKGSQDNAIAAAISVAAVERFTTNTPPLTPESAPARVQTAALDNATAPQARTIKVADVVAAPAQLEKSSAILKSLESYQSASTLDTNTTTTSSTIADRTQVATNVDYKPAAIKNSQDNAIAATISVAAVERFTTNAPAAVTPESAPATIQTAALDNVTAPIARTIQVADVVIAPAQPEKSGAILKSLESYQSASTLDTKTTTTTSPIADRAEVASNVVYKPAAIANSQDNATATISVAAVERFTNNTPAAVTSESAPAKFQTAALDNVPASQAKTTQLADKIIAPAQLEKSNAIIKSLESYKSAQTLDTNINTTTSTIADRAEVATNVASKPVAIKDSQDNTAATNSVAAVERFTNNTPAAVTPEIAPAKIQTAALDSVTAPQAKTIQLADAVIAPAQLEKSDAITKSIESHKFAQTLDTNANTTTSTIADRAEVASNVAYKTAAIKDSQDNATAVISVAAVERFTNNTPAAVTPEIAPARFQTAALDSVTAPQSRTTQLADAVIAPAQLEKSDAIIKSIESHKSASTLDISTVSSTEKTAATITPTVYKQAPSKDALDNTATVVASVDRSTANIVATQALENSAAKIQTFTQSVEPSAVIQNAVLTAKPVFELTQDNQPSDKINVVAANYKTNAIKDTQDNIVNANAFPSLDRVAYVNAAQQQAERVSVTTQLASTDGPAQATSKNLEVIQAPPQTENTARIITAQNSSEVQMISQVRNLDRVTTNSSETRREVASPVVVVASNQDNTQAAQRLIGPGSISVTVDQQPGVVAPIRRFSTGMARDNADSSNAVSLDVLKLNATALPATTAAATATEGLKQLLGRMPQSDATAGSAAADALKNFIGKQIGNDSQADSAQTRAIANGLDYRLTVPTPGNINTGDAKFVFDSKHQVGTDLASLNMTGRPNVANDTNSSNSAIKVPGSIEVIIVGGTAIRLPGGVDSANAAALLTGVGAVKIGMLEPHAIQTAVAQGALGGAVISPLTTSLTAIDGKALAVDTKTTNTPNVLTPLNINIQNVQSPLPTELTSTLKSADSPLSLTTKDSKLPGINDLTDLGAVKKSEPVKNSETAVFANGMTVRIGAGKTGDAKEDELDDAKKIQNAGTASGAAGFGGGSASATQPNGQTATNANGTPTVQGNSTDPDQKHVLPNLEIVDSRVQANVITTGNGDSIGVKLFPTDNQSFETDKGAIKNEQTVGSTRSEVESNVTPEKPHSHKDDIAETSNVATTKNSNTQSELSEINRIFGIRPIQSDEETSAWQADKWQAELLQFEHRRPYKVKRGESLADIARKEFGNAQLAQLLIELNADRLMLDANGQVILIPGSEIRLPSRGDILRFNAQKQNDSRLSINYNNTSAKGLHENVVYACRLGETLQTIAKRHPAVQDARMWPLIAKLNDLDSRRDKNGASIAKLQRGQHLILPTPEQKADYLHELTFGTKSKDISADFSKHAQEVNADANKKSQEVSSSFVPAKVASITHSHQFESQKQLANHQFESRLVTQSDLGDAGDNLILKLEISTQVTGEVDKENEKTYLPVVEYLIGQNSSTLSVRTRDGQCKITNIDLPDRSARELAESDLAANAVQYCFNFENNILSI